IIHVIQLRASDQRDMFSDKIIMEISVGVGSTVCRNQKIRIFIIRSSYRYQLDLYRPLGQFLCRKDSGLVIGRSLPFFKSDRARGTAGETVPKPVAVIFPGELRFSIYHFNRPLMTGVGADSAAVAFFFIN